jgi:uncharacterized protein (DUF2342 family)
VPELVLGALASMMLHLTRQAMAAALGIALTPLAAVLACVDPGLAKDAHCAALLAEVQEGGVRLIQ